MEKVRIPNLLIENIGPFGRLELSFPEKTIPGKAEIHILTGENGTGETTILESLVLLQNSAFSYETFFLRCHLPAHQDLGRNYWGAYL